MVLLKLYEELKVQTKHVATLMAANISEKQALRHDLDAEIIFKFLKKQFRIREPSLVENLKLKHVPFTGLSASFQRQKNAARILRF